MRNRWPRFTWSPVVAGKSDALTLPGTMQAWTSARIFARVSGYVRSWDKDIGAPVGSGTPLGYIDTPDLDQQIIQARATLLRTKAQASLARSTATRWNDLLTSNSVSHQEADENAGAATASAKWPRLRPTLAACWRSRPMPRCALRGHRHAA
jgi:multidrug efflux pump subunit AcrA (membrane-fusion protein)